MESKLSSQRNQASPAYGILITIIGPLTLNYAVYRIFLPLERLSVSPRVETYGEKSLNKQS